MLLLHMRFGFQGINERS